MAQTYNFDGVNIVIPGSYVKTTVINNTSGIATTGVIALVGEADSGPDYSLLTKKDLSEVAYTPDQFAIMKNTFMGGDLVEAFNSSVAPFLEAGLTGGPTLIYVLKTNKGEGDNAATKASALLQDASSDTIATLSAKQYGSYGDQIGVTVATGSAGTGGFKPIALTFKYKTVEENFTVNDGPAISFKNAATDAYIVAVTATGIDITGPSSFSKSYTFADSRFTSLKVLVDQINADCTGKLVCEIKNAALKYVSPINLIDIDTHGTGTAIGVEVYWSYSGYQLANIASQLVDVTGIQYITPVLTGTGAKIDNTSSSLLGGKKGVSTQADIKAALAKLEGVRLNFVVPLFSKDSTTEVLGDPTYTIDQVIADTVEHVTNMSKIKSRRNRQAFLSLWKEGPTAYSDIKAFVASSSTLKNTPYQYRTSMAFQKIQVLDSSGSSTTFDPWMVAAIAAASQAVAGYRPIFNKAINCTATFDPTGFEGAYEDALLSGLLPMRLSDAGTSQTFLSDQTTYLFPDNNFVYNSIQAVYGADIIALTIQQQMQSFVGQSVADVTAGVALSFLQSVLATLLRNKWISASSDAPSGFKNASVSINAPVMNVAVECKESTGIYFVPINLSISNVTSST
jgi:hypothetical protein